MKILIAIDSLKYGGAERVAALWAQGFSKMGYAVAFVIHDGSHTISYDLPASSRIFNLYQGNDERKYKKWAILIPRLRRIVNEYHPDVIINILGLWCLVSWIATFGKHVRLVNTEHSTFLNPPYKPMRKTVWVRKFWINKLMDCVTVITQFDKDYIGNKLKNVVVLPNPLSFKPLQEVPVKERVIVAAGRLDAWHYKGFDLLIEAWGRIANKYPDWKLLIAGNCKTKRSEEQVRGMLEKINAGKQIELLGFCKNIEEIFRGASIFVLSSRYEGFGLVLVEAMSQGCACIACNYQGRQGEIITSDNQGLLIEPNNAEAIAEAIEQMIRDNAYRIKVQKNAIERSKNFELYVIMGLWDGILKQIVCH